MAGSLKALLVSPVELVDYLNLKAIYCMVVNLIPYKDISEKLKCTQLASHLNCQVELINF